MPGRASHSSQAAAIERVADASSHAEEYRAHLKEILDSPIFKASRRSLEFLTYIVEKSLAGHFEELKERSIGVEVFGRSTSYDTGADAIVRVTASDVRRRLLQYYAEARAHSEIRIELPAGSYIPKFLHHSPTALVEPAPTPAVVPAEVTPQPKSIPRDALYGVIGFLAVALLAIGIWSLTRPSATMSPATRILPWSLLFSQNQDLEIIFCDPDISLSQQLLGYEISLSDYANQRYLPDKPSRNPESLVFAKRLRGVNVASVDSAIAMGISRIANGPYRIRTRTARALHILDFKSDENFVILGSPRSNPWFGLFQDQLDFRFEWDPASGQERIRNHNMRQGESAVYSPTAGGWGTGHAYAIVALVRNSNHKGNVLLLAGSNAEATEASGEFVTNVDLMSRSLRDHGIDPHLSNQRFQILLRVGTMAGSPGKFEVIACHRLGDR